MDGNGTGRQRIGKAAVAIAASQKNRGNKLAAESSGRHVGPDRDNVIDIVRHKVGAVLDGLAEAKEKVQAAKRLQETAKAVGDHQVENMIAGELQTLGAEAKTAA